MKHFFSGIVIIVVALVVVSCHSTRKIQSAINTIDTIHTVMVDTKEVDSAAFIKNIYDRVQANRIDFSSFSAKIKVDYRDKNGKGPELTVLARIVKDSVIWLSINATVFSYEAFRVMVTPDSVKVLNKRDKVATLRSVSYLQEIAKLPVDFYTLQDLIIGNAIFFNKNIISYQKGESVTTLLSVGEFFKNLLTINNNDYTLQNSKLDDVDSYRNRTCYLAYGDYEMANGKPFAAKRTVSVSEKSKLDVEMDFKQYNFNESLVFPFTIPKNYNVN